MQRTIQQQDFISAVIEAVQGGVQQHFCLRARAGTGKTSTMMELVDDYRAAFASHEITLCAFNKAAADEMQAKLEKRGHTDWRAVKASTIHSLGFGLMKNLFRSTIDAKKVMKLINEKNNPFYSEYASSIAKLVSFAKLEGFGFFPDTQIGDTSAWYRIADHYDINGFDDTSVLDSVIVGAQNIYRASLDQTNIIDFDDMILFPLVKNIAVRYPRDLLIVDEAQDTGRARQALLRKFVKAKGTMIVVGDDKQCQPGGTKVYKTGQGYVPIETLKVGDQLLSFSSLSAFFPGKNNQGRKVEAIASHTYKGQLIKITADEFKHEVTPNHRCLVRMTNQVGALVYLMKKGNHVRVGMCQSKRGKFGLSYRANQEGADAAWVIKFFDYSELNQARKLELIIAYKYGIPQICFRNVDGGIKLAIRNAFWAEYPNNINKLDQCLKDFSLDIEYPFLTKQKNGGDRDHKIGKYSFLLNAINLFDGWMQVCTFNGNSKKPRWVTAKISRRNYHGKVYSLKVQPTEGGRRLYVAQGIVTHNSIYGFAGAQANALDQLVSGMSMKVLPLTICWRCPRSVIQEAQKIVPDIEWAPDAQEGSVSRAAELPEMLPTDALLCRNTAPLIEYAYALLRQGVACKVEGREIGSGLLRLVNRWKVTTIDTFLQRLANYQEREIQKAMAKGKDDKVEQINDKCETIVHICNVCIDRQQTSLADVRKFIEEMFSDDVAGVVTLCTYHRSKGREWPRVFLIEHKKRCPSPYAKHEWQKHQEQNLAYVAITRAAEALVYLN